MRKRSATEAAWLGAMVEGEGSIILNTLTRRYPLPVVVVYSSDIETISTCLRLAGAGCVYMRPRHPARHHGNKMMWAWSCQAQGEVAAILNDIVTYLTSKQEKAYSVLAWLKERPIGRNGNGQEVDDA